MIEMICRICNNPENNKAYQIREMMFGFRDEFTYIECSKCGCLQIAEIPKNMEKYYPRNYYSFQPRDSDNFMKRFALVQRDRYVLFNSGFIGKLVYSLPRIERLLLGSSRNRRYPWVFDAIFKAIAKAEVSRESQILDVGCGSGAFLHSLRDLGFRNLVGVDPYTGEDEIHEDVRILKKTINDLPNSQQFDLIIFNHSLEHIADQLQTLLKVSDILKENGVCLIRMPVKTEHIWNLYGVDWVQIDAPRHFFIHTVESFDCLAKEAGLLIRDVNFDSTGFQFWGSEQYKKGIPLQAENSCAVNPAKSIFTAEQTREFERMTRELNKTAQGDQAALYLRKKLGQPRET